MDFEAIDLQKDTNLFSIMQNNMDLMKNMQEQNSKPAVLNNDDAAIRERDECNFSLKISKEMALSGKAPRRIRVYTDGIYDLFHFGHARQLMQAKNLFPNIYLMVGVCNDEISNSIKSRTVMNEYERCESLRHCRYVNEVIRNAPLIINETFLNENKIDFVAQDPTPYPFNGSNDVYEVPKNMGIFLDTKRTDDISTSDLICRIVRDYDLFVERNLIKGYSVEQLNLKCFKEKERNIEKYIKSFKAEK